MNENNFSPDFLSRSLLLFGAEKIRKFQDSHVLVLGVGGVGGYAAEMLVRSGIGEITIVDGDLVEASNLNRQIIALNSNLGEPKVLALKKRLLDINPACKVHEVYDFIRDEKISRLLSGCFDYAVDAIDSLSPKVHFLAECIRRKIPVISSMGAGGKVEPGKIIVADISKTHTCHLARAVRQKLNKMEIRHGITAVFSSEITPESAVISSVDANGNFRSTNGSSAFVVAAFSCNIVANVLKNL